MSNCKNICSLCPNLVISTAVNFDSTNNRLIINLPAGNYSNGCKYCIVVAQSIPTTTTISALVFISITGNPNLFPLTKCNCQQVTACNIRTRTRYSTVVSTNTVSGVFKLLSNPSCCGVDNLDALPTTAVTTPALASVPVQTSSTATTTTLATQSRSRKEVSNE